MNQAAVPWSEVAERLRPFIAGRVSPSDVEDVVQDVLVRMHRSVNDIRDDDRFAAWVFQIARNAIAEHGRTRARHPLPASPDVPEPATPGDVIADDDRAAASSLAGCVTLFVARLESPYREAVTLVELEGMTNKQAAEMVGVSTSAMKSRVQRGRAQLREMFERCCEIALDARGKVTEFTPRVQPSCGRNCGGD